VPLWTTNCEKNIRVTNPSSLQRGGEARPSPQMKGQGYPGGLISL
jgi:hypothetical protein